MLTITNARSARVFRQPMSVYPSTPTVHGIANLDTAFHIRPYSAEDYGQTLRLWQACGLTRPWNDPAQDIALCLQTASSTLLVGVCAERVIGSVMAGSDGHRGWLYYLAIDPAFRRRGFARELVRRAEEWLMRQGVRKVELMIRERNRAARDFYERIGYGVESRLLMSRWLEGGPVRADAKLDMRITYLEMRAPPGATGSAIPGGVQVLLAQCLSVAFYRYLYNEVGAAWLWYERRRLEDHALAAIIEHPQVRVLVSYVDGVPAGYAELDGRVDGEIELAYLGLLPQFIGRGLGRHLLDCALREAWRRRPQRVWVHTCNFDHPRALAFYERAGFVRFKQESKSISDPRIDGTF